MSKQKQYSVEKFNDTDKHSILTDENGNFIHLFMTEPSAETKIGDWVIVDFNEKQLTMLHKDNIDNLQHFSSKIVASTLMQSQVDSSSHTNYIGGKAIPFELCNLLLSNPNDIWIDSVDDVVKWTNLSEKRVHSSGNFNLTGHQALKLSKEIFKEWLNWTPLKDYVDINQLNQFMDWLDTYVEFNPSIKSQVDNLAKFVKLKQQ